MRSLNMKTVKFYTLGCKVNQYETQTIREKFQRADFSELEHSVPAEVCVINTCTVTHRADRSSLYLIRRAYRENPNARIIVTGCLTQFDSDKISSIPGVSLIVKNKDKSRIISLLNKLPENYLRQNTGCRHRQQGLMLAIAKRRDVALGGRTGFGITYFKNHSRAFLKIQDGCDYHCSYCKVRLVRGKSRSRAPRGIKKEVGNLVRNSYPEIVLSGICLGSYGRDLIPELSLAKLVGQLQGIGGCFRIRLSSIEVNDISDELIHIMKDSDRLCKHLHIPVQSGDEKILRRMGRAYSPEQYIKLIERIKRYIPQISITTDVMVGFPGETEANFKNTIELIKKIQPLRVHIFPYSKRLNTPAYNLGEFVSEAKIKARMAALQRIAQSLSSAYYQRFISQVTEALAERRVFGCSDLWEGYTDNYIKVRIKSALELKNQIVQIKLRKVCNDFVLADTV